jgi:hypothetical protein
VEIHDSKEMDPEKSSMPDIFTHGFTVLVEDE